MTSTMEDCLMRLNGRAMSLLWEGHEDAAVKFLERGLVIAQRHQQQLQLQQRQGNKVMIASNHANVTPRMMRLEALDLTDVTERTSSEHNLVQQGLRFSRNILLTQTVPDETLSLPEDDHHHSVYSDNAASTKEVPEMMMEENPQEQCCDDEEQQETRCLTLPLTLDNTYAAMAYNLAVIHHENGLSRGIRHALGHARQWYQAALSKLEHASSATGTDNTNVLSSSLRHVWILLWTNLGHVAVFLDDPVLVCICRCHVAKIEKGDNSSGDSDKDESMMLRMMQKENCFAPAA